MIETETDKIYEFLHERNKVNLNWKDSIHNIGEAAGVCAHKLTVIKMIIDYRNEEEKQKKKRMPSKLLRKKIDKELEALGNQMKINPDADHFYFPGGVGINGFFQHKHVKPWIITILDPKLKIFDNLSNNLETAINGALAILGAFYAIWDREEIYLPVNIIFLLFDRLAVLIEKTNELYNSIEKSEEIGDRNSRNASTTPIKINKIKLSDQYPKLKQILSNFDGAQEEKTAIDRILIKILKTKNEKTLRKYRQYLLDNFDHEKQDVN